MMLDLAAHDGRLILPALALNQQVEIETSPLDLESLRDLVANSFAATAIGEDSIEAFLIALDETARYDSPNFLWFRERHPRFVYVDRIVTAPQARGRGLARRLYEDLFARARAAGHTIVCCEVNIDPPNPVSDAFHARLGFLEVGRARLGNRQKTVRYLAAAL